MKTETFELKVPITKDAHQYAKEFAAEQRSQAKKAKVYLNTLAVCAVRNFLNIVQIETDVELSSAWNPIERACFDVADLFIPHLDTSVECRPVLPDQEEITLPPEVREDRIGYVFVKFDNDLQEAELLGFMWVPRSDDDFEDIDLDELKPLEDLFTVLKQMENVSRVYRAPTFVKVKEECQVESSQELALQWGKIFHTVSKPGQRAYGTALLRSYRKDLPFAAASRSEGTTDSLSDEESRELGDLAEALLEELAEIWGEE